MREVQALKQQCHVQASQFKVALERLQEGQGFELTDLRKEHLVELERLREEHEARKRQRDTGLVSHLRRCK